jgi:uncharacterized protein (TIGR03089 family)
VTPAAMLRRELERDGARPLLTWYDDGSGARVELSVATVANWAAKLANLLVDEHDVEPGVDVGVRLPALWQTAVLLLGIWTAGGCAVVGDVGEVTVGLPTDDVATVRVSPDTMGMGLSRLAGAQPDDYLGVVPVDGSAAALRLAGRSWSHDELGAAAGHAAHVHGLDATSRVLSTLGYDTVDGLDAGLLVPLAAGGSVVLVTNPDPARLEQRRTAERVTHVFLD